MSILHGIFVEDNVLYRILLESARNFSQYAIAIGHARHIYPSATSAEGVLSLPPSVRLSVRPSVRRKKLVRAITFERTDLESPNLVYRCTLGGSRMGLYME